MKIAILGAGAYGTALGEVLVSKGYNVDYYDKYMEGARLDDAVKGAEYIVLCVPSAVAEETLNNLPKNVPLIVATKGFLSDEIFGEFTDYMVMSGPGFAADIKMRKDTKLTATDDRIVELFGNDHLTFDRTTDRRGVLMCGALKNVYAIMAGWLGLEPGTKQHEEFLTDVAEEMQALLTVNGANPDTVNLVCGIGDLRLTCSKPSRNYEFGCEVRKDPGYKPKNTVEGLTVLQRIKRGEIKVPDGAVKLKDLIERSAAWN